MPLSSTLLKKSSRPLEQGTLTRENRVVLSTTDLCVCVSIKSKIIHEVHAFTSYWVLNAAFRTDLDSIHFWLVELAGSSSPGLASSPTLKGTFSKIRENRVVLSAADLCVCVCVCVLG